MVTNGQIPVAGARVVLRRSAAATATPVPVPNGSEVMSPANRQNPATTGPLGDFHWDVIPGFYRVTAQHRGCTAGRGRRVATTNVLSVPPPVTDLVLTLRCPHLRRAISRTTLNVTAGNESPAVLLRASVASGPTRSRRSPSGLVTFRDGQTVLGTAPVDPDTGQALLVANATPGPHRYRARYAGDGYYGASLGKH